MHQQQQLQYQIPLMMRSNTSPSTFLFLCRIWHRHTTAAVRHPSACATDAVIRQREHTLPCDFLPLAADRPDCDDALSVCAEAAASLFEPLYSSELGGMRRSCQRSYATMLQKQVWSGQVSSSSWCSSSLPFSLLPAKDSRAANLAFPTTLSAARGSHDEHSFLRRASHLHLRGVWRGESSFAPSNEVAIHGQLWPPSLPSSLR